MLSLGIYTLPPDVNTPTIKFAKDEIRPMIKKYVLLTSQWQLWNIFAPNPLRRTTYYAVDIQRDGEWYEKIRIDNDHFQFWNVAYNLKMLRRLEKEDKFQIFRERYLVRYCDRLQLQPNDPIRLVRHYYVIPKAEISNTYSWWSSLENDWKSEVHVDTTCPTPHT